MSTLSFITPAKINLGLIIHQKLNNGYHQVETIMHRLPIYDQIDLHWPNIEEDQLECHDSQVPNNSENLIIQAYNLLKKDFTLPKMKIILTKNIPLGAGLGGGSFNAGVFIRKINHQFQLQLTDQQLKSYGLQLGADIPFAISEHQCIWEKNHGLPSLETEVLPSLPPCQLVLIYSPFSLDTKTAYQQYAKKRSTLHNLTALAQALKNQDLFAIGKFLHNDFATQSSLQLPQLQKYQQALLQAGALGVSFTGKGPTLYGLFPPTVKIDLPFAHQIINFQKDTDDEKNQKN